MWKFREKYHRRIEKNAEVKKDDSNSSDITVMTTYAGKDSNAKNYQDALKKWQKKTGYIPIAASLGEGLAIYHAN